MWQQKELGISHEKKEKYCGSSLLWWSKAK